MNKNIIIIFLSITLLSISINLFYSLKYENIPKILVGFSPGITAEQIIINAINSAKFTIDLAAYSFTNKNIIQALINSKHKGVKIRILMDKKINYKKNEIIKLFLLNKISIKLNNKYCIMHNKFMIIDNRSVQTGSFNYSSNARLKNAENVIYIKNNNDTINKYIIEYERLWKESDKIFKKILK